MPEVKNFIRIRSSHTIMKDPEFRLWCCSDKSGSNYDLIRYYVAWNKV